MEIKDCSAILLAGGFSSRMGCCKAELDGHGVPLVQHQAEKLRLLAGCNTPEEYREICDYGLIWK